jgi:hypothetical protein
MDMNMREGSAKLTVRKRMWQMTGLPVESKHSQYCTVTYNTCKKRVNCPCNRPWRPIGLWDVETSTFYIQSGSQMAWRLSGLCIGRPLPPGRFLVLIYVRGWVDSRAIVRLDLIGFRTRDLPACSIVPQPTTLPRAPHKNTWPRYSWSG